MEDEELGREFIALARLVGTNEDQCEALCYQADLLGNTTSAAVRRSSLLLEAARLLSDGDDLSRVRLLLEDSLASWPENVDAVVALGRCLEQLGDSDALFDLLEIEMKLLLPGTRRGLTALRLADLGMKLGREQDAVDKYLSIAQGDLEGTSFEERLPTPGTIERGERPVAAVVAAYVERAHEMFDGGQDVSEIVNILEDALGLESTHQDAYLLLAEVYRTTSMIPELHAVLERHASAAGEVPIRAQLRFERGQLFLQGVGQKDKAMQQFIHVLADEAATFELLQTAVTALLAMEGGFSQAEQCRTLLDDRIRSHRDDAERARLLVLRARVSSNQGRR